MTLGNLDFLSLLPAWMRSDAAVIGLANGIDRVMRIFAEEAEKQKTWDQIDKLGGAELDELAWEFGIDWYYADATIETKREIIRDAELVQSRLGTKWAIERVISTYFGNGYMQPWYEYGGQPYCFRVWSDDRLATPETAAKFLNALDIVKAARSHLDQVLVNRVWADLPRDYGTWAGVLAPSGEPNTWASVRGIVYGG